jgi:MSHA biogenesis protein MshQ
VRFGLSTATGTNTQWLRFDLDGNASHDDDPTARATFGIFNEPQVVIFIREPWD